MAIKPKIYEIKISMNHVTPLIWRRFQVRDDVKLTRLHDIIQVVMGWENYHAYCFSVGGVEYTDPDYIDHSLYEVNHQDGSNVKLCQALTEVDDQCLYLYDFGDNWEHTLKLEKIIDPEPGERYPICLNGERCCPPEDCGGIQGYQEHIRALVDPTDEEYEKMRQWLGEYWDPEKFSPESVNTRLPRRVVMKVNNG